MAENPPYLLSPGTLKTALEKIKSASTPPRFTGDFVETVIGIKGGSGRALIPFLKRIGLVGSDGTPTELYNLFRNPTSSSKAAAQACRIGFKVLYEFNEYIHKAKDEDVKGAIIQATGFESDSRVVQAIFGTFKTLKAYCDFDGSAEKTSKPEEEAGDKKEDGKEGGSVEQGQNHAKKTSLNLSYTINLNLPATDDVRVFDAIFRSLKENILKE